MRFEIERRGSAAEGWERMKKGPEYEVKCHEVALRVKVRRGLNPELYGSMPM